MTDPLYDSRNPNHGRAGGLRDPEPRLSAGSVDAPLTIQDLADRLASLPERKTEYRRHGIMHDLRFFEMRMEPEERNAFLALLTTTPAQPARESATEAPLYSIRENSITAEQLSTDTLEGKILASIRTRGNPYPMGSEAFEAFENGRRPAFDLNPKPEPFILLQCLEARQCKHIVCICDGDPTLIDTPTQPQAKPIICTCRYGNDCDGSCQCPPPGEYLDKIAHEQGIDAALEAARTPVARSSATNAEVLIERLVQAAAEYENNCDRLVAKPIRVELEKAKQAIRDAVAAPKARGNYEDRHPTDDILWSASDHKDFIEVVEVLGLQESDQTPADAVRELQAEIERLNALPQTAPSREDIARVIGGDIFHGSDDGVGPATRHARVEALKKADAILALSRPHGGGAA
jgi:hypothetical protein